MKRICVVGTWHQPSIVSACFADMRHQVFGVGDNPDESESLNAAKPLVREPKLQAMNFPAECQYVLETLRDVYRTDSQAREAASQRRGGCASIRSRAVR